MNWYLKVWQQYADFSGRARRMEYWMFQLFNILVVIAIAILGSLLTAMTQSYEVLMVFAGLVILYYVVIFIPNLAVLVRRLHDTGKSGWWMFIAFVPFIGSLWLLILLFTEGESCSNQYGDNPKATNENEYAGHDDSHATGNNYDNYNRNETSPVRPAQKTKISIGRDYSCDICVDNSFEDVSRNHATLTIVGGALMFEDNSTNGSFVNGQGVHRSRQVVNRGDRIVLGRRYILSWDDINQYFQGDGSRKTNRFI